MKFSSQGAFVGALQKGKIDKIWPSEEKGDTGKWNIEYIAFFAQPLNDSEIQVKFFDITGGEKKLRRRRSAVHAREGLAHLRLQHRAGEARVRRAQALHDDDRDRAAARIATTQFWLLGKGAELQRQGRVQRRRCQGEVIAEPARGGALKARASCR